ncbi:MAG: ABC transporter substrate-binding protein [Terriglobales bacterium]
MLLLVMVGFGVLLGSRRSPRHVRLAYAPIMGSLPVFIAQDQGLFQKEGVQPETVPFSSSNDMVSALVAGQVDLLPAVSLVPLIHLEIQHPGKIRVFATSRMKPENSTYRIVVKSGSPVQRLQELSGKKMGVFPGTSATRLLSEFLVQHKVDPKTIAFVQLPPAAQVASLESGAVDALFSYDPLSLIGEPGRYRDISNSVYGELSEFCPVGVSVIARDFERTHPEAAAAAANALQHGIEQMGAHPQQAAALLPHFTKMTPEMALRVKIDDVTLSNAVDVAAMQRFIDLLYQIGEIPEKIDAHRLVQPTR